MYILFDPDSESKSPEINRDITMLKQKILSNTLPPVWFFKATNTNKIKKY